MIKKEQVNEMNIIKTKKLSTRLVLLSMVVLIILNLISAICMSFLTGWGMDKKQDAYLQQTAVSAQKQVEEFLDKYSSLANMLGNNGQVRNVMAAGTKETPLSMAPDYAEILNYMQKTMEAHADILGIGFGSINEDRIYTYAGEQLDAYLSERPYYSVVNTKQSYITDPYIDSITGELCVSVVVPVMQDSVVVGILIMDLKLEQISTYLASMSFGESGRLILMGKDNVIIGYEDHNLVGQDFTEVGVTGDIMEQIDAPTGELTKYKLNGESKLAIMLELPETGWKLLVGMSRAEYNEQTVKIVLFLVLLLLTSTVIVCVFLRTIIVKKLRPISEINKGLKQMSQGNLHITIEHTGDDEVGQMADSMRTCVQTLWSYVNEIDTVMAGLAAGDLTTKSRVQFKGDFIHIEHTIAAFTHKLTDLMSNIYEASVQVSGGSNQVAAGAQALAQGATEQASAVQELAASITDISNTVSNNTQLALDANRGAVKVNADIAESGNKMRQSMDVMAEISESSDKIRKIIKTIEDIAFQTNILALNAAVEAARAGQAGRGFAVVADEVRSLATKTNEASQNTTALIEESLMAVQRGTTSMQDTARFMERVVEEAQKITTTFQTIASASESQANAIGQITLGVDQISNVVQTNSATAEQSAAASQELSMQAQTLKKLMAQFKFDHAMQQSEDISFNQEEMMEDQSMATATSDVFSKY